MNLVYLVPKCISCANESMKCYVLKWQIIFFSNGTGFIRKHSHIIKFHKHTSLVAHMFSNGKGSQTTLTHTIKFIQDTGSSNICFENDTGSQIFFILLGTNFLAVVFFFLGVPWVVLGHPLVSVGWTSVPSLCSVPSPIKNANRLKKRNKSI